MLMRSNSPLSNLDKENMLGYIHALPEQLEHAWKLGQSLPLPPLPKIDRVLVAGMGGSAIGGDLLAAYCRSSCAVPIISHRDYDLPAWAEGPATLVICSSHSGNTEETLSAFAAARSNGCTLLTLSTGGKLAEAAQEAGVISWLFEHTGQPRTAVGYSFGMLLALLHRLGLISGVEVELRSALDAMRTERQRLDDVVSAAENPAKRLADLLEGRNISIFAAGTLEVVARRWKTQVNELAKAWAQFEGLPEANHNTLAGTLNPAELISNQAVVFLRSDMDHPRNQVRHTMTRESIGKAGFVTAEVWGKGETFLAQMWTLLQMGDYTAYYLALNYGVDPTPIPALNALKKKLSDI